MSIDVSSTAPSRRQEPGNPGDSSLGRWLRRGLLGLGLVAVLASAATLIRAASSRQSGPRLTHIVKRGDLVVTVTERGSLESSENTEIKCQVRGRSTIIWVIDGGTLVEPGDELLRLDTLLIDDAVSERSKYAHWSRSAAEYYRSHVARSKLAIPEYLEGRYRSQLMTLEKDLAIAESNLRNARNMLDYSKRLFSRSYITKLQLEESTFALTRAEIDVQVKTTEIGVLEDFTKAMQLETLKGNLSAAEANLAAAEERAIMDGTRRDIAVAELKHCVIKAETGGMVIHPSAPQWKNAPEIEEGASVHKDQVLLLMPDLWKMQVTIGIHESIIDRIKPGLAARVRLPDKTLTGRVSSVASVTAPAGWWTGDVVKYETIIELPPTPGLRPGMSAEVEVIIDRHQDVLTIPVAPLVETAEGNFCWVRTADGTKRRSLKLGDTNDVFTVVKAGLKAGDEVVLNPLPFIEESQIEVLEPSDETKQTKPTLPKSGK